MEEIDNGLFVTPMQELSANSWKILYSLSEKKKLNRRKKNE